MSTLFFIAFIGPISWFYHPEVHDKFGNCMVEPGSYKSLWCKPTDHVGAFAPMIYHKHL